MAYKGNSKLVVSSSFLYSTLQTFYTKIKGLLDNKADKTALNSINPNTISGGYTKNSFYVNTHPENSGAIIPFVNNDIAFLLKRGGSAKIYYDDVETSADISNVFDGSPSYWAIDPTNIKKVVIELTLHKTFTWTNTVYVDFGSAGWRAKSVTIDVINTNNKETEWTNKSTITNNSIGEHKITFSHNSGTGFNKVRFTFSDWASASIFRIACLGLVNFGSSGLRETFLPKDGGSVYGGITPYTNNSIDLGSSSLKWKNVYATTFNGNLSGNASSATTLKNLTSTVTELNYCDGVTSNIQTQINTLNSSLDDCFQSVSDGKTLVANAITDKGIKTDTSSTFATIANNISKITTGTDTSDATATASNILSGKTAYVKGSKITGSMPNRDILVSDIGGMNTSYSTLPLCKGNNLQITTPTVAKTQWLALQPPNGYYSGGHYIGVPLSNVASLVGASADKILSGNTICGVSGSIANQAAYTACHSVAADSSTIYIRMPKGAYLKEASNGLGLPEITATNAQVANAIGLTSNKLLSGNTVCGVSGSIANNGGYPFGGSNGAGSDAFNDTSMAIDGCNIYNSAVGAFDLKWKTGYVNGYGRLHIPNLLPSNIKAGVKVGWKNAYIEGTAPSGKGYYEKTFAAGSYTTEDLGYNKVPSYMINTRITEVGNTYYFSRISLPVSLSFTNIGKIVVEVNGTYGKITSIYTNPPIEENVTYYQYDGSANLYSAKSNVYWVTRSGGYGSFYVLNNDFSRSGNVLFTQSSSKIQFPMQGSASIISGSAVTVKVWEA